MANPAPKDADSAFPQLSPQPTPIAPLPTDTNRPATPKSPSSPRHRSRTGTVSSVATAAGTRLRSASLKLIESDVPLGAWAATAAATSRAPSLADIRKGAYASPEFEREKERRASVTSVGGGAQRPPRLARVGSAVSAVSARSMSITGVFGARGDARKNVVEEEPVGPLEAPEENKGKEEVEDEVQEVPSRVVTATEPPPPEDDDTGTPADEYQFPPKLPWTVSFAIAMRAFWKWFLTPLGFLITIYALNVVAWGGMLFLLLCNASPAMCHPTCNDIKSPRRVWIEIDSQILNGLFCVTGFGLIPWRFRDLYWLLVYRIGLNGRSHEKKMNGLRRLAGIHRGWFRLQGSEKWREEYGDDRDLTNEAVPLPLSKRLEPPLTGQRALPTATWRLDFVIWCACWNTFLQVCLCGFMWGFSR